MPIASKPQIASNSLVNQSKAAVTVNPTPAAYALFIPQEHPTCPLSIKHAYAHPRRNAVWLSIPYKSKMQPTHILKPMSWPHRLCPSYLGTKCVVVTLTHVYMQAT